MLKVESSPAASSEVEPKNNTISYRRGTPADSYAVFTLFEKTLSDLVQRMGLHTPTSISNPQALAQMWGERCSLYQHLARTASNFWVAERDGDIIGFSRSLSRGSLQQLTEFFVLPDNQSSGVGRELFNRTFPDENVPHRSIIATLDTRAQARYLKAGVYPRFPIYYFSRVPEARPTSPDLTICPITATPETLDTLGAIDSLILKHRRDEDHSWFLSDRQGYLYLKDNQPVGYGYVGHRNGPFALLEADNFPAVLAHAENLAAKRGDKHFGVEVPMINQSAVDYLLEKGFQMDKFMAVFMSNVTFGKFEHYIFTSPPFFM